MKNIPLSHICRMHYLKLGYRTTLFLAALALYVLHCVKPFDLSLLPQELFAWDPFLADAMPTFSPVLLLAVAITLGTEMVLRFFPSRHDSHGAQKHMKRHFVATDQKTPAKRSWVRTFLVVVFWLTLNGIFAVLYYTGIIDANVLFIIGLAYSVCDLICILFFCPFQTWFLKNRCCATCRIYNWDFIMMTTPLALIPSVYTYMLFGLSLILFIQWEILVRRHPERFSEETNAYISCANCPERLCRHKPQLQGFLKKHYQEQKKNDHREETEVSVPRK